MDRGMDVRLEMRLLPTLVGGFGAWTLDVEVDDDDDGGYMCERVGVALPQGREGGRRVSVSLLGVCVE